jgi:hypothetical protein
MDVGRYIRNAQHNGEKKELLADHFDGPEVGGTSSEQQQCARAQLL